MDDDYLTKLARVDLEPQEGGGYQPLEQLLSQIRAKFDPHWLLIDVRAGLSPAAGLLLGSYAHLHVLFGTTTEQSWVGLRQVLMRMGAERVRRGEPQAECLLVHAMLPDNSVVAETARASFEARAVDEFRDHYYASDDPSQDRLWSVNDIDTSDAPHVPVPLSYSGKIAFFEDIEDIADDLVTLPEYVSFGNRIVGRFPRGEG
jgi:hypothetical protein